MHLNMQKTTTFKQKPEIIKARTSLLIIALTYTLTEITSWSGIIPSPYKALSISLNAYLAGSFGFMSAATVCFVCTTWLLPIKRANKLTIYNAGCAFGLALNTSAPPENHLNNIMNGLGIFSLLTTIIYLFIYKENTTTYGRIWSYLLEISTISLFILISSFYLSITVDLLPITYDMHMLNWDSLIFGYQPSIRLKLLAESIPGALIALKISYIFLPAFMIATRLSIANKNIPINITTSFLGTAAIGYCIYFIAPVCGPIYLLGDSFLDGSLSPISSDSYSTNAPLAWANFPRNGVPSLHIAWALSLFFTSMYLGVWTKVFTFIVLALTICATLALGEHYVLDLLIAVPFTVLIQSLFTTIPLSHRRGHLTVITIGSIITAASISIAIAENAQNLLSPNLWLLFWSFIIVISILLFRCLYTLAIGEQTKPKVFESKF